MTAASANRISAEILRAVNLAKHYGEEEAIADITFSVTAGEVLGIVGPNGAGKTISSALEDLATSPTR
jgi:ABC-type branched-subunit amino acid transport system ATPase component